jgi:hypothetical protein
MSVEMLISPGLVVVGFLVGTFVFARVGRWVATLYELLKDQPEVRASRAGRLVSASLLSSGPWILILAVVFAYYVSSKPWAVWLFAGFCGAIVVFSLFSIYLARKAASARRENAA